MLSGSAFSAGPNSRRSLAVDELLDDDYRRGITGRELIFFGAKNRVRIFPGFRIRRYGESEVLAIGYCRFG